MAAYIPVPRDLTRVKSKILFNLTKRQLLCFGLAALIGVPSFFLIRRSGNISMAAVCMIVIMMPFFLLGMYERDGQPLEKIAKQFIEAKFVRPCVRPYQTNNYYAVLIRQAQAEKEVNRIVFSDKSVSKDRTKNSNPFKKSE
ncbi:MAG: PrgI family protein [Lachnospiraceae bacterium]|nr:PrgI family protein [Lachnospiraceae bacterium]